MTHANTDTSSCHQVHYIWCQLSCKNSKRARSHERERLYEIADITSRSMQFAIAFIRDDHRCVYTFLLFSFMLVAFICVDFCFSLFSLLFSLNRFVCASRRTIYFIQFLWYDVYLSAVFFLLLIWMMIIIASFFLFNLFPSFSLCLSCFHNWQCASCNQF